MRRGDRKAVSAPRTERPLGVVLHVLGCRSVQRGSFEDQLIALATSCAERQMRLVLAYPEEPASPRFVEEIERAGGSFVIEPSTAEPSVHTVAALWRTMRQLRPQVVHAHFGRVAYVAVAVAKLRRVPRIILTKHHSSGARPSRTHRLAYGFIASLAGTVIGVSESLRADLLNLGVSSGKTVVLPIGVDKTRFRPLPEARARLTADLGLPADAALITCVSHLRAGKGMEVLLEAVSMARADHPMARCLIVGDGSMRAALERQCERLGLGDCVHFLGFLPDVTDVIAGSDVIVCPSLSEGGGSTTLEAMAAGRAVISTSVGYAQMFIDSGRNGILVPPGDPQALAEALDRVLSDPAFRIRLAVKSRKAVESAVSTVPLAMQLTRLYERPHPGPAHS